MKNRLRIGVGIAMMLMLCISVPACSEDEKPIVVELTPPPTGDESSVNILFIGNSLTYYNDMPGMLREMLKLSDIDNISIRSHTMGGWGLVDHWTIGNARQAVAEGGWDLIVLQQGPSATKGRPSLLQYSRLFKGDARMIGAEVAMYMVWPSNSRFFDFDGVSDSYATAAENISALLFPAGEAWRAAWALDATMPLYGSDAFHPSIMGSYLAALSMFLQITGLPANTVPAQLTLQSGSVVSIPASKLATLHAAAEKANQEFGRSVEGWPITTN
jgi:hypothetical protein